MLEIKTKQTKTGSLNFLYNNLNMDGKLEREFEAYLKSKDFRELSYLKKQSVIDNDVFSCLYILMFGKQQFNRVLAIILKHY